MIRNLTQTWLAVHLIVEEKQLAGSVLTMPTGESESPLVM